MERIRIRNLKTGREYTVTGQDYAMLQGKGYAARFTVIERVSLVAQGRQATFMPDELRALLEGVKEEPKPVTPSASRGKQRDHGQNG